MVSTSSLVYHLRDLVAKLLSLVIDHDVDEANEHHNAIDNPTRDCFGRIVWKRVCDHVFAQRAFCNCDIPKTFGRSELCQVDANPNENLRRHWNSLHHTTLLDVQRVVTLTLVAETDVTCDILGCGLPEKPEVCRYVQCVRQGIARVD